MQPINYMLDVAQPLQMALAGYTQGQAFRSQQQGMEQQRRLMEMQEAQFAQQQQALQQQQARAQEMQIDMADYAERIRTGDITPEYVIGFSAKYPELAEGAMKGWDMLSDEQRRSQIDESTRLYSAFNFNPEVGIEMLKERKAAAENAGDTQQVTALDGMIRQAEMDPAAVQESLLIKLNSVMDPKQFENFLAFARPKEPEAASAAGKILADYNLGKFGPVGSPEAMQIRDQQLDKAGGGVQFTMPPGAVEESAFEKKVGELQATSISTIADQGQTARRNRQTLNQLEKALMGAPAGIEAGLKGLAVRFGIDVEGAEEIDVATALISQLVPGQRPQGSGTMSDADLQLFKDSLPRLMGTREGRLQIVANMKAISDYIIAEGDLADAVLDGTITRAQYRERARALGNPLAEFSATAQGAAPATGTPSQEVVPETATRYGITPQMWAKLTPEQKAAFED